MTKSSYRVELIGEFSFIINETVHAAPGATRQQLEETIEDNWWWISGSTDVLLESSWELENFEELPAEVD
jgi:hypothetical protein